MKNKSMKDMWDSRYESSDYVYGKGPNQFFKDALESLKVTGSILLPAEGEGRNAVYAAQKGLEVHAFDISRQAKIKAMNLAKENNVQISYEVGELSDLFYPGQSFDAAALIYAHLPPNTRQSFHREIAKLLKPGGVIILEGFSKNNLEIKQENPEIGGPNIVEMLFSEDEIRSDFSDFEMIDLREELVELNEGNTHRGLGKVIRFIGKKHSDS